MDDFFKSLKDNLEHRKEPVFQEESWSAMQSKLEADAAESQPKRGLVWWIPFFGMMLLGSGVLNYWFYQQLEENKNFFSEQKMLVSKDTILQINTIYKTDTIYNTQIEIQEKLVTRYITRSEEGSTLQLNLNQLASIFKSPSTRLGSLNIDPSYLHTNNNQGPLLNDFNNEGFTRALITNKMVSEKSENFQNLEISNQLWLEELALNSMAMESLESNVLLKDDREVKLNDSRKKSLVQRLYPMRPKQLIFGINGGTVKPTEEVIEDASGSILGATAEIAFSDHFRLTLDANYLTLKFKAEEQAGEQYGIPVIDPPSDEFRFEDAELTQKSIQYGLGIKYMITTKNSLNPFIGVGVSSLYFLPYEVTYEFQDTQTNLEILDTKRYSGRRASTGQMVFNAGFEYQFNSNWALEVDAYYHHRFNDKGLNGPNIRGLRAGLLYHF